MSNNISVGDTVQRIVDDGVGSNADRYTARVTSVDGSYATLEDGRWFDIHGQAHDIATPGKIHTDLLRKMFP